MAPLGLLAFLFTTPAAGGVAPSTGTATIAVLFGEWRGGHECNDLRTRLWFRVRKGKEPGTASADWRAQVLTTAAAPAKRMRGSADLTPDEKPGEYLFRAGVPEGGALRRIMPKAALFGRIVVAPDGRAVEYRTEQGIVDLLYKATGVGKLDEGRRSAEYDYRETRSSLERVCRGKLERVQRRKAQPKADPPAPAPPPPRPAGRADILEH